MVGAKRGPAPAHAVPIWLGAYKPRMLALTGRRADGWLPTLGYLQPGDLAKGNAIIDDAAVQAGRSPRDVRRLLNISGQFSAVGRGPLNGPADQWVQELAELALEEGVSAFILATEDPDDLRRFAGEVAPAVRELVAAGRDAEIAPEPEPEPAPVVTRPARASRPSVTGGAFAVVPTPTTAGGAATGGSGTSRPGRPAPRATPRAPTPRTSRPPVSISCRCTTACAPSSPRSTT
ncbi:hypothetical protein GCM10027614_18120 [Micromonospora vulcania]